MRRHWQHTSFCMGQCVSSCGSKRTLDSVPTTPDTENYPGLLPISSASAAALTRSVSSGKSSSNFSPSKEHHLHHHNRHSQSRNHQALALVAAVTDQSAKSPAAKFVTAFSQRKISSRRINPGGESPLHISGPSSSPSILPLKITTLLSPAPVSGNTASQDGDMKGTPAKSYFRDTISSAKKSSFKTVTFSEAVPVPSSPNNTSSTTSTSTTRKKSFFSFSKSAQQKKDSQQGSSSGTNTTAEKGSSESPHLPKKGFLRRKSSSRSPTPVTFFTRPVKEKQICRVTLSLKQSSTKKEAGDSEKEGVKDLSVGVSIHDSNGDHFEGQNSPDNVKNPQTDRETTMGNVGSGSSSGGTVGLLKQLKPVVKSSSVSIIKPVSSNKGDINENVTTHQTLSSSKSVENPGVVHDDKRQTTEKSKVALRDLNSIREENRLLRLKFFTDDSPTSPVNTAAAATSTTRPVEVSAIDSASKMSRQNNLPGAKSAIPLPKSFAKPTSTASTGIPKLYSVAHGEHEQPAPKTLGNANSRSRYNLSAANQQQPSNLHAWVPAAEFFVPPTSSSGEPSTSTRQHTSPATTRNPRRSSEPPRWLPGSVKQPLLNEANRGLDPRADRRGTVGFQPRKVATTQSTSVAKVVKSVTTSTTASSEKTSTASIPKGLSRIGVRKPEETKPFYTLGLYQPRPKPVESTTSKTFGVHQSGFHGVSTGIVRQRAQQFQAKTGNVPKTASASEETKTPGKEESRSLAQIQGSPSPNRPGVIRSATYTIRKHAASSTPDAKGQGDAKSVIKAKSDVDPRYLTWTKKSPKASGSGSGESIRPGGAVGGTPLDSMIASIESENSFIENQMGYPLQHNASATSTSSMGTNEDGACDHAVISDSEYLIDDEISDQPDLTLTFKDSSLKLSSSSSGESLLSCDIMLDHLDHNQDRILGELTSDSAISDISSHKPVSQSSSDQISRICEDNKTSALLDQVVPKTSIPRRSPIESPSPSSVRTVKNPKSPRRIARGNATTPSHNMTASNSKPVRQPSGDSITSRSTSSSNVKPSGNTPISSKQRAIDARLASGKPSHVRSILASPSIHPSSQLNQQRTPRRDNVADLTVENVNKLHKQYELAESSPEYSPAAGQNERGLPVPFMNELLVEFQGMKEELEKLRIQLETQESREKEKDELILRLTGEVERLKSVVDFNKTTHPQHRNGSIIPTSTPSNKERFLNSLNYENAAVQTENNNIFNRAVTYPDEEDKYGELVSFRIGRSSSVRKKL